MEGWSVFWRIFSLIFLITAIPVAMIIILEKRSPFKTIAWILVLILLPVIGVIFYLFFGQEYRKRKIFSYKATKQQKHFISLATNQLNNFEATLHTLSAKALEKRNIIRLLLNNSNALLTSNNRIKVFHTGHDTFNAIFSALDKARHHIHLEYYIFSDDVIGNKIKDLLIKKRKEGVQVRMIVDDVGSWGLGSKFITNLRKNGIHIYSFGEVRFPRLTSRVNFRNHRKILIVDGQIAITGGSNIADRYLEGLKKLGPWRDLNIQIEGDAVACLQVVFTSDWHRVINENLVGDVYFPMTFSESGIPVQIATSGPDMDWENINQAFFAAISNARKQILIVTPYLMPPSSLLSALKTAALSHVDVQIIIPEKSDVITPKWSSFSYVGELLEAGIKVYFYKNGFIHSKYIIVDDAFVSVGTSNFDFRSLETNFEVNAFIYEEEFTSTLKQQFITDLKHSRLINLDEWNHRPWHFKIRESLAHIVAPMM